MTEPKSVKRPAIEHVIYRMPLDGAPESGQFDPRIFEKTIYDPELISDEAYIELGCEAAVDAKRRGELRREWAGEYSSRTTYSRPRRSSTRCRTRASLRWSSNFRGGSDMSSTRLAVVLLKKGQSRAASNSGRFPTRYG